VSAIEYLEVSVTAGPVTILSDVAISIPEGQRVAFLGRSGAGKTTALKLVNGLVLPTRGAMRIEGRFLTDHDLVALRRRIGYVLQQPALFPHRSVFDNIATVPRLLDWSADRIHSAVEGLLERLALPATFAARYPRQLSGGEQQRVAIARALIASPSILLCDEPFSALDPLIREDLQSLLRTVASNTTLVFVTHDVREALTIGERTVVFDQGRIIADTPSADFAKSDHPLVRRFAASVS
jgi:osmoprotectant transport system ATP-binding protein